MTYFSEVVFDEIFSKNNSYLTKKCYQADFQGRYETQVNKIVFQKMLF